MSNDTKKECEMRIAELVKQHNFFLFRQLVGHLHSDHMSVFSEAAVHYFDDGLSKFELVKFLSLGLFDEVSATSDYTTLFRGNTSMVKIIGVLLRQEGAEWLRQCILPTLGEIVAKNEFIELDEFK